MQLEIGIFPSGGESKLPFSYHHCLGSLVHQLLESQHVGSSMRLYGFTPLCSRQMEVQKDPRSGGLIFKGYTSFRFFSPNPDLHERVAGKLISTGAIEIGDAGFSVQYVNVLPLTREFSQAMIWRPAPMASILTSYTEHIKDAEKIRKLFLIPGEQKPDTTQTAESVLRSNLIHKWQVFSERYPQIALRYLDNPGAGPKLNPCEWIKSQEIKITVLHDEISKVQTKLHEIKGINVRSWRAPIEVVAPVAVQRLVWAAGLGGMTAMGFGGVG